jgi:IS5 family transposase
VAFGAELFKILVLQALYGLSDDQAEFQIQDRLSFMRFLGLGLEDRVPDAKTIWLFRERLTQAGAMAALFGRFDRHLDKAGYLAMGGQIVDATIVAAPKQRDIAVPAFGYKNHASIDRQHGFIRGWTVTGASAYDGAQLRTVLDKNNTGSKVLADTAYRSKKNEAWLNRNGYPSQETKEPVDERGDGTGQWPAFKDPRLRRACLRPSESPHGSGRPHPSALPAPRPRSEWPI